MKKINIVCMRGMLFCLIIVNNICFFLNIIKMIKDVVNVGYKKEKVWFYCLKDKRMFLVVCSLGFYGLEFFKEKD